MQTSATRLTTERPNMQLTLDHLDWGSVGVIGGAIYATYQALTNNQIKNAILELKLSISDRFAKIEKDIAILYERHLALLGTIKDIDEQILQLHKDIAYRDGKENVVKVVTP